MLTKSQTEGLQFISDKFKNGEKIVVLQGSAGTGKTFLLQEVVKEILYLYGKGLVAISAPTHKALSVLKEKINIQHSKLSFDTVHSLLKMKRCVDEETGEEYFAPSFSSQNLPLKNIKYLIVDEVSMVDSYLLSLILKYGTELQILFIGDTKQLPPVKESTSPVFDKGYPTFTLTEIVRQSVDNPIIKLSNDFKNILNNKLPDFKEGKGYVFTDEYSRIIERLSTGDLIYLAYTNEKVDKVNYDVRTRLFKSNCDVQEGETIVLQKPYGEDFKNNETLKIQNVVAAEKIIPFKYKKKTKEFTFDILILTTHKGKIEILQNKEKYNWLNAKKEIKKLATKKEITWKDYVNFTDIFADFKFGYAMSVHKSQGSTFRNVVMDLKNIELNRNREERNKLIYTAITRASDLVVIYVS